MESYYIVKLKNQTMFCFYHLKEEGIMQKVYKGGKWSKADKLLSSGRENYTVTIDESGKLYLLCQNIDGDVVLFTNEGDTWSSKIILKNNSNKVHSVLINPIITERGMCLIYNAPSDSGNYIAFQTVDKKGWQPPQTIDKFISMNEYMFCVQPVTHEHLLLFYQMRTAENNIGYREITPLKQSSYNIFHTTSYQITSCSFLTTNNAIYVLYVVKSMFSYQLIYRKKEDTEFSNPVVLYEAQKLENCLLFFASGNLYATFIASGQLYQCVSENMGRAFSRPARYRKNFCSNPVKATYISEDMQSEHDFFAREVYVDKRNPCDIQILPELCNTFYPSPKKPEAKKQQSKPYEQANFLYEQDEQYIEQPIEHNERNEIEEEVLGKLQNRLHISERQNKEKDSQLMQMSNLLKIRSEEITKIEIEHREERRKLLNKIKELEQNINSEHSRRQNKEGKEDKEEIAKIEIQHREEIRKLLNKIKELEQNINSEHFQSQHHFQDRKESKIKESEQNANIEHSHSQTSDSN